MIPNKSESFTQRMEYNPTDIVRAAKPISSSLYHACIKSQISFASSYIFVSLRVSRWMLGMMKLCFTVAISLFLG